MRRKAKGLNHHCYIGGWQPVATENIFPLFSFFAVKGRVKMIKTLALSILGVVIVWTQLFLLALCKTAKRADNRAQIALEERNY
jgi:hypothetical protein